MAIEKKYVETPLMKQYYAVNAVHPDAILLFRVGDFYETFGDDYLSETSPSANSISYSDASLPLSSSDLPQYYRTVNHIVKDILCIYPMIDVILNNCISYNR